MRLPARRRRSRHGTYYYRWVLPRRLSGGRGGKRRELAVSLRNTDRGKAITHAHRLSAYLGALLAGLAQIAPARAQDCPRRASFTVN